MFRHGALLLLLIGCFFVSDARKRPSTVNERNLSSGSIDSVTSGVNDTVENSQLSDVTVNEPPSKDQGDGDKSGDKKDEDQSKSVTADKSPANGKVGVKNSVDNNDEDQPGSVTVGKSPASAKDQGDGDKSGDKKDEDQSKSVTADKSPAKTPVVVNKLNDSVNTETPPSKVTIIVKPPKVDGGQLISNASAAASKAKLLADDEEKETGDQAEIPGDKYIGDEDDANSEDLPAEDEEKEEVIPKKESRVIKKPKTVLKGVSAYDESEGSSSAFFTNIVVIIVLAVCGYIAYHNRAKLRTWVIQGRAKITLVKPKLGDYNRLSTTADEVLPTTVDVKVVKDYIY